MQCNYHLLSINFALRFVDTDIFTIGYEPEDLTVHPPPRTAEGGLISFVYASIVFSKKTSSKESLNTSELFRFKDPKTYFFSIFTQTKF